MKPVFRQAAKIVALFSGAVGLILLALWLVLPRWIEARLVPEMARRFGIAQTALEVRRLGPTGLDAAGIRVGQALTLEHLTADYHLSQLARGRIERIVLSGLTIRALQDENGIRLDGIETFSSGSPASTPNDATALRIGRLEVHGGLLVLTQPEAVIHLPFSLTAVAEREDLSRISARLVLFPHQDPIRIMLRADTAQGDLGAVLEASDTGLDLFDALLPPAAKLHLGGRISARAEARLNLSPFQVLAFKGNLTSTDLCIRRPDFQLAANGATPLNLAWNATGRHEMVATFSGALNLAHPLNAVIDDLQINAALAEDATGRTGLAIGARAALRSNAPWSGQTHNLRLTAAGHLDEKGRPAGSVRLEASGQLGNPLALSLDRIRLAATGSSEHINMKGDFVVSSAEGPSPAGLKIVPPGIKGSFSGRLEDLTRWQANLGLVPAATILNLAAGDFEARMTQPQLDIDLGGEGAALSFAARFGSQQGRILPKGVSISWPALTADANGTLDLNNVPGSADLRFALALTAPTAAVGGVHLGTRKIGLQGRVHPDPRPEVIADLRIDGGSLAWPAKSLKANNIFLRLPLRWPATGAPAGTLGMETLVWQHRALGRLEARIHQTDRGVALKGRLEDILIAGLAMEISGQAAASAAGTTAIVNMALAPWSPPAPVDLGTLVPAAAGLTVDGRLSASAALALDAGSLKSKARIQLADISVTGPDENIHLTGIQTDLEIVDIAALRSAPGQVVRFAEAVLGNVLLHDGAIQFQVEAPHQILLEKGAFGWCGGRVYAEAMRFSPAVEDYDLTLFCDRLGLAELLDQLGGLTAEGGGTVNGRIPVHFRKGRLDFNDGFLYSSPGDGGKIRLTGVDRLIAGIGPQSVQYAQLALASEALKDYDYNWVKVGINSQGDQLALRLQFDGKPAHPLPFVYRGEPGRFVRVEADNPGSRFQGIGLDVNLRLPLNRILQYGGLMKMIESPP